MPANLTPEYRAAEAAFRRAREPGERLEWLREMLRVIPRHKGTDHLQGDIKRRIKELSEELERPRKGAARGGPVLVVRPEGAAQIALIGPPNTGKSSLHARLTGSGAQAAADPFTTQHPEPGMMPHEDIHFQLVDLPAVSPEHSVPWLASALQTADACLLVVALDDPACLEQVEAVHSVLRQRRVELSHRWEVAAGSAGEAEQDAGDPFALRLPTLLLANKADRLADPAAELRAFLDVAGLRYPALAVSASAGSGSRRSAPGCSATSESRASTRERRVAHPRGIGRSSCTAVKRWRTSPGSCTRSSRARSSTRACGAGRGSTGNVGQDHPLADGDVVELHA
jgi:hypothetical protein